MSEIKHFLNLERQVEIIRSRGCKIADAASAKRTLSTTLRFYSDLKTKDQKALAKELSVDTPKILTSRLRCRTDLRNICASHGRLYYRIFSVILAGLQNLQKTDSQRIYGT